MTKDLKQRIKEFNNIKFNSNNDKRIIIPQTKLGGYHFLSSDRSNLVVICILDTDLLIRSIWDGRQRNWDLWMCSLCRSYGWSVVWWASCAKSYETRMVNKPYTKICHCVGMFHHASISFGNV